MRRPGPQPQQQRRPIGFAVVVAVVAVFAAVRAAEAAPPPPTTAMTTEPTAPLTSVPPALSTATATAPPATATNTTNTGSTPSPSPISSSTSSPSPSSTAVPTVVVGADPCAAAGGRHGAVGGPLFQTVAFAYAVTVRDDDSGNDDEAARLASVLPALEIAMARHVVPAFFPGECPPTAAAAAQFPSQSSSSGGARVAGLSASPADRVDPEVLLHNSGGGGCDGGGGICFGVRGEMTLYFFVGRRSRRDLQANDDANSAAQLLRTALREAMDAGSLDGAHPDIVRVAYVPSLPDGDGGNNNDGDDEDGDDKDEDDGKDEDEDDKDEDEAAAFSRGKVNPHSIAWPLVAAVALLGAAGVVCAIVRRRRKRQVPLSEEESRSSRRSDDLEEGGNQEKEDFQDGERAQTATTGSGSPPSYDLTPVTTATTAASLASGGAALPAVEESFHEDDDGVDDDDESSESDDDSDNVLPPPPPASSSSPWGRWDAAPSDEFAATPVAAASLPGRAPAASPSGEFNASPVPVVTPRTRKAPSPSYEMYSVPVPSVSLQGEITPPQTTTATTEGRVDVAVPPSVIPPYPLVHRHPHSHPPPTTADVDDDSVARHPSTAETGLLRILDRHENTDVEHLHEHLAEDDDRVSVHPLSATTTTTTTSAGTGETGRRVRGRVARRHGGDVDVEHWPPEHKDTSGDNDTTVSSHSSSTETRLLRIVERQGNLEVEHLHERTR